MKILCEVPLGVGHFGRSQFRWLRGEENYLFTFENERKLRIFSIQPEVGTAREVQSASLAESRVCSCLSWNRDESLLALVVDRKQIYFWDVKRNQFSQFKPRTMQTTASLTGNKVSMGGPTAQAHRKSAKMHDIEFVAWSKVSDKLAICYASGQILLCQVVVQAGASEQDNDKNKPQQQQQQQTFATSSERFIDNSESLLKKIASIEVCEHAELFACTSIICEILVMSFDGQTKFYCQSESASLLRIKFSPLNREYSSRTGKFLGHSLHLAYQLGRDKGLYLKQISLDLEQGLQETPAKVYMPREQASSPDRGRDADVAEHPSSYQPPLQRAKLLEFHWLDSNHVMLCLESGSIQLIQIEYNLLKQEDPTSISCTELLRINQCQPGGGVSFGSGIASPVSSVSRSSSRNRARRDSEDASVVSERSFVASSSTSNSVATSQNPPPREKPSGADPYRDSFTMFELVKLNSKKGPDGRGQCFALAAATNFKLFYFELYENTIAGRGAQVNFSFEHLDDVDISDSLQRANLRLERASWSTGCSMLALQVTSGHLLVYKTRSQSFMVVSHGSKTAYLSAANEVTILNYGLSSYEGGALDEQCGDDSLSSSNTGSRTPNKRPADNAIILSIQLKPSLLAIGPTYLALSLNNRVRFYPLGEARSTELVENDRGDPSVVASSSPPFHEQEYITIVVGISLSSRFAAIQFDDGRLKLHPIRHGETDNDDNSRTMRDDERFFPDPSQPETITAFSLTEELLVYCTKERRIKVFSLISWRTVQECEHTGLFLAPVTRLKPNNHGNKFVCLIDQELVRSRGQDNVFLYDLYSNSVTALSPPQLNSLMHMIFERQIKATSDILTFDRAVVRKITQDFTLPARPESLDKVVDALWDTDGRTLLLVESKSYHVFAILHHTLEREEPIAIYALSAKKPASYTMLYISQGVVSYQTGSGRVINSILETHDDELRLTRLEMRISALKQKVARRPSKNSDEVGSEGASKNEATFRDSQPVSPELTSLTSEFESIPTLEAQLRVIMLKVEYLLTIQPIYSLSKCRDICNHLMEEESFNLTVDESKVSPANDYRLIKQLLPRILASWALFTLNLNFARLWYKRNDIQVEAVLLDNLLSDIKIKKMDSRLAVNRRLLTILDCIDP